MMRPIMYQRGSVGKGCVSIFTLRAKVRYFLTLKIVTRGNLINRIGRISVVRDDVNPVFRKPGSRTQFFPLAVRRRC